MKPIKALVAIFRSYTYGEKVLTGIAFASILAMFVKMMLFPYGVFNFGEANIYTEGLVSSNGFQNINPLFVDYNSADREVSRLVFSGLMKYDPDKRTIVDDMAVLTINEDKTEYTFALRQGLKWHDGAPVTADDVYFTYHDVVMDKGFNNDILRTNFGGIGIEQIDEKTIKFSLEKPNIFFVSNFTTGILPKHILGDIAPYDLIKNEFNKKPVGTGPYMMLEPIERFSDGRMQATLERSPYYYSDPSAIEKVRFIAYPTMAQLIDESNSVNGIVRITGNDIAAFKDNERFNLISYELPQYTAVFMNMESQLIKDDKNIRLALQKAVDKGELIALFNDKIAVDTPLMQLDQKDWVYQASAEQAEGALKDAGYSYDDGDTQHVGYRFNDDGEVLELRFVALNHPDATYEFEETLKTVNFLKDSWEKVGFSIIRDLQEPMPFKQILKSRSYDLLFIGQSLGYNLDTYSYWHSTQADPMGQNLSNYKSFNVDSLIENIRAEFEREKRDDLLLELAEQMKEDIPAIFLYRPVYYYATDSKIEGISMDGLVYPSDRFSRISEWVFS